MNNQQEQAPGPQWVWIVIETKGEEENIYALEDEHSGAKFIPIFQTKEDGVVVQAGFKKTSGAKYDVEAMHIQNLAETAQKHHLDIYILNGEGKVIEKLSPFQDA